MIDVMRGSLSARHRAPRITAACDCACDRHDRVTLSSSRTWLACRRAGSILAIRFSTHRREHAAVERWGFALRRNGTQRASAHTRV